MEKEKIPLRLNTKRDFEESVFINFDFAVK